MARGPRANEATGRVYNRPSNRHRIADTINPRPAVTGQQTDMEEIRKELAKAKDDHIIFDYLSYKNGNNEKVIEIQHFRFDSSDEGELFELDLVDRYKLKKLGEGDGKHGPISVYIMP